MQNLPDMRIKVTDLVPHEDDRGRVFEVLHNYDLPQDQFLEGIQSLHPPHLGRFGQVYVVESPARGTIRAFHCHRRLWDYFCIVKGSAKLCFVDDSDFKVWDSLTHQGQLYSTLDRPCSGACKMVVISEGSPKMITVPPGWFHGWMSLTDNTVLVSVGSEIYNPQKPDEFRVPPDFFDQEFGCDPWEIKGR